MPSFVWSLSGPCTPEHVTTLYSFTIGQVQWDMTLGADYYTVRGETDQGLIASCVTNDTYCALYNMVCSQTYNITVTAYNRVCEGHSTAGGVTITTGEGTLKMLFTFFMSHCIVCFIYAAHMCTKHTVSIISPLLDLFCLVFRALPTQQRADISHLSR